MANIQLDPGKDPVILDFQFNTPQAFYYVITVMDDQGKQYFHDTGAWNGKTTFTLGSTEDLTGYYLKIAWTIIDLAGEGNDYSAVAYAIQLGSQCVSGQTCVGKSSNDASYVTSFGKFE